MKLSSIFLGFTSILLVQQAHSYSQDKNLIKITKSNRTTPLSPEEQLKTFKLAEGFVIELVASEKNGVINPIDLTFDDAGRLWTQTAEMYPLDPFPKKPSRVVRGMFLDPKSSIHTDENFLKIKQLYTLEKKGTDRILVINDPTKPVTGPITIVADGLTIPQSILPYKNGVYVAHGSEMLYIEDKDKDDKFESPKIVLTGFGVLDTHTMSHSLVRGPGGWIHFSQGAMNLGKVTATDSGQEVPMNYSKIARFSLDGKKVELVNNGLNNIWGFQLRANGQWYGSEANDKGMSVVPMSRGTGFEGIGNDKLHPYQPFSPRFHDFRVGGSGLSGLAFSEDSSQSFPDKWKGTALLANTITNTINSVKIKRDASGKVIASREEDLLTCSDDWFRPVNIEFGPDGCLYIADWYNKVVSHNEIPRDDPSRDKTHGRIWRIRHESQKSVSIPNLIKAPTKDLVQHLSGPTRWEKRAAWHQIADRKATDLIPELKVLLLDQDASVATKVHAIWAFESLGKFDAVLIETLLKDSNSHIKREVIRSLASFDLSAPQLAKLLQPLINDAHHTIRAQVIRTIEESNLSSDDLISILVEACKPAMKGNTLGGSYERNFERYLARRTLEKNTDSLIAFLSTAKNNNQPVSNLLVAIQALPTEQASKEFVKLWSKADKNELDLEAFVSICSMIDNKYVLNTVKDTFEDSSNFKNLLSLAIASRDRVTSKVLPGLLAPALETLIQSQETDDQLLAMDAAATLKSSVINADITKIVESTTSLAIIEATLPVLALNPKAHISSLNKIATDSNIPFKQQLDAAHLLLTADAKKGNTLLGQLIKEKTDTQIDTITNTLSQSIAGSKALLNLVSNKVLKVTDFNLSSAQRVNSSIKKNQIAQSILKDAKMREAVRIKSLDDKINKYITAVETMKGDPSKGKIHFQSCLMCHQVGNEGQEIAPALDGSAERELHALMTAIVNPDAAVEGGYNLHRVVKKDGSSIEGYLDKQNNQGITIALMGGTKIFIPNGDIKTEGTVGGRSFMPDMFGNMSDQAMVDLITYIKTALVVKKSK